MNDIQLTRIKEMIANNNTEDAILELKKTLSGPQVGDYEKVMITMEAESNNLKGDYLKGLIENAEYRRERLKLNHRVLELVNLILLSDKNKTLNFRKDTRLIADPINRQEMLGQFSKELFDNGEYGILRQKGAFSSFSIPNREPFDPIWLERDGNDLRNIHHYECSWLERKWLEVHVTKTYCRLIINPSIARGIAQKKGRKAALLRLKCSLDFFESNKDRVDIVTTTDLKENITILGNWFVSQSNTVTNKGYGNTMFEWDKSIVEAEIKTFDLEFQSLLESKGMDIYESKKDTLGQIRKLIDEM